MMFPLIIIKKYCVLVIKSLFYFIKSGFKKLKTYLSHFIKNTKLYLCTQMRKTFRLLAKKLLKFRIQKITSYQANKIAIKVFYINQLISNIFLCDYQNYRTWNNYSFNIRTMQNINIYKFTCCIMYFKWIIFLQKIKNFNQS